MEGLIKSFWPMHHGLLGHRVDFLLILVNELDFIIDWCFFLPHQVGSVDLEPSQACLA